MEDKNELDQMFSTHFESTAEKSPAIKNHRIAGNLARKIERFERGEIDDDYLRELAEVAESHGMTISDFVVNIANVGMTSEGGVSPVTMVYTIDEEPTHITGAPGDESDDDDDDDDVHVIIELPQPTNWSSLREKDNGGFIEAYLPKDSATQSYSVSLTIHRTEDGQITDARIPVKEDLNLALLYGVLKYPWLTKADMSIVTAATNDAENFLNIEAEATDVANNERANQGVRIVRPGEQPHELMERIKQALQEGKEYCWAMDAWGNMRFRESVGEDDHIALTHGEMARIGGKLYYDSDRNVIVLNNQSLTYSFGDRAPVHLQNAARFAQGCGLPVEAHWHKQLKAAISPEEGSLYVEYSFSPDFVTLQIDDSRLHTWILSEQKAALTKELLANVHSEEKVTETYSLSEAVTKTTVQKAAENAIGLSKALSPSLADGLILRQAAHDADIANFVREEKRRRERETELEEVKRGIRHDIEQGYEIIIRESGASNTNIANELAHNGSENVRAEIVALQDNADRRLKIEIEQKVLSGRRTMVEGELDSLGQLHKELIKATKANSKVRFDELLNEATSKGQFFIRVDTAQKHDLLKTVGKTPLSSGVGQRLEDRTDEKTTGSVLDDGSAVVIEKHIKRCNQLRWELEQFLKQEAKIRSEHQANSIAPQESNQDEEIALVLDEAKRQYFAAEPGAELSLRLPIGGNETASIRFAGPVDHKILLEQEWEHTEETLQTHFDREITREAKRRLQAQLRQIEREAQIKRQAAQGNDVEQLAEEMRKIWMEAEAKKQDALQKMEELEESVRGRIPKILEGAERNFRTGSPNADEMLALQWRVQKDALTKEIQMGIRRQAEEKKRSANEKIYVEVKAEFAGHWSAFENCLAEAATERGKKPLDVNAVLEAEWRATAIIRGLQAERDYKNYEESKKGELEKLTTNAEEWRGKLEELSAPESTLDPGQREVRIKGYQIQLEDAIRKKANLETEIEQHASAIRKNFEGEREPFLAMALDAEGLMQTEPDSTLTGLIRNSYEDDIASIDATLAITQQAEEKKGRFLNVIEAARNKFPDEKALDALMDEWEPYIESHTRSLNDLNGTLSDRLNVCDQEMRERQAKIQGRIIAMTGADCDLGVLAENLAKHAHQWRRDVSRKAANFIRGAERSKQHWVALFEERIGIQLPGHIAVALKRDIDWDMGPDIASINADPEVQKALASHLLEGRRSQLADAATEYVQQTHPTILASNFAPHEKIEAWLAFASAFRPLGEDDRSFQNAVVCMATAFKTLTPGELMQVNPWWLAAMGNTFRQVAAFPECNDAVKAITGYLSSGGLDSHFIEIDDDSQDEWELGVDKVFDEAVEYCVVHLIPEIARSTIPLSQKLGRWSLLAEPIVGGANENTRLTRLVHAVAAAVADQKDGFSIDSNMLEALTILTEAFQILLPEESCRQAMRLIVGKIDADKELFKDADRQVIERLHAAIQTARTTPGMIERADKESYRKAFQNLGKAKRAAERREKKALSDQADAPLAKGPEVGAAIADSDAQLAATKPQTPIPEAFFKNLATALDEENGERIDNLISEAEEKRWITDTKKESFFSWLGEHNEWEMMLQSKGNLNIDNAVQNLRNKFGLKEKPGNSDVVLKWIKTFVQDFERNTKRANAVWEKNIKSLTAEQKRYVNALRDALCTNKSLDWAQIKSLDNAEVEATKAHMRQKKMEATTKLLEPLVDSARKKAREEAARAASSVGMEPAAAEGNTQSVTPDRPHEETPEPSRASSTPPKSTTANDGMADTMKVAGAAPKGKDAVTDSPLPSDNGLTKEGQLDAVIGKIIEGINTINEAAVQEAILKATDSEDNADVLLERLAAHPVWNAYLDRQPEIQHVQAATEGERERLRAALPMDTLTRQYVDGLRYRRAVFEGIKGIEKKKGENPAEPFGQALMDFLISGYDVAEIRIAGLAETIVQKKKWSPFEKGITAVLQHRQWTAKDKGEFDEKVARLKFYEKASKAIEKKISFDSPSQRDACANAAREAVLNGATLPESLAISDEQREAINFLVALHRDLGADESLPKDLEAWRKKALGKGKEISAKISSDRRELAKVYLSAFVHDRLAAERGADEILEAVTANAPLDVTMRNVLNGMNDTQYLIAALNGRYEWQANALAIELGEMELSSVHETQTLLSPATALTDDQQIEYFEIIGEWLQQMASDEKGEGLGQAKVALYEDSDYSNFPRDHIDCIFRMLELYEERNAGIMEETFEEARHALADFHFAKTVTKQWVDSWAAHFIGNAQPADSMSLSPAHAEIDSELVRNTESGRLDEAAINETLNNCEDLLIDIFALEKDINTLNSPLKFDADDIHDRCFMLLKSLIKEVAEEKTAFHDAGRMLRNDMLEIGASIQEVDALDALRRNCDLYDIDITKHENLEDARRSIQGDLAQLRKGFLEDLHLYISAPEFGKQITPSMFCERLMENGAWTDHLESVEAIGNLVDEGVDHGLYEEVTKETQALYAAMQKKYSKLRGSKWNKAVQTARNCVNDVTKKDEDNGAFIKHLIDRAIENKAPLPKDAEQARQEMLAESEKEVDHLKKANTEILVTRFIEESRALHVSQDRGAVETAGGNVSQSIQARGAGADEFEYSAPADAAIDEAVEELLAAGEVHDSKRAARQVHQAQQMGMDMDRLARALVNDQRWKNYIATTVAGDLIKTIQSLSAPIEEKNSSMLVMRMSIVMDLVKGAEPSTADEKWKSNFPPERFANPDNEVAFNRIFKIFFEEDLEIRPDASVEELRSAALTGYESDLELRMESLTPEVMEFMTVEHLKMWAKKPEEASLSAAEAVTQEPSLYDAPELLGESGEWSAEDITFVAEYFKDDNVKPTVVGKDEKVHINGLPIRITAKGTVLYHNRIDNVQLYEAPLARLKIMGRDRHDIEERIKKKQPVNFVLPPLTDKDFCHYHAEKNAQAYETSRAAGKEKDVSDKLSVVDRDIIRHKHGADIEPFQASMDKETKVHGEPFHITARGTALYSQKDDRVQKSDSKVIEVPLAWLREVRHESVERILNQCKQGALVSFVVPPLSQQGQTSTQTPSHGVAAGGRGGR